jgi:IMP dehydrogenase
MDTKFTFDDFILLPSYAEEDVREFKAVTNSRLFNYDVRVPIISAPMDTVTGIDMMDAIRCAGGIGVHHRYCSWDTLDTAIRYNGGIAISPSMSVDKVTKLASINPRDFFVIDVAHGDSERVYTFCRDLIKNGVTDIVSGNIVTVTAALAYMKIGIKYLRVGMGNGSRCTTRLVTGFGYPQASAIQEIYGEVDNKAVIISDGGCKNTGDIIKAFSLGASFVMTGYLFAGCDECPKVYDENGKPIYRGMASKEALEARKKDFFIEGVSMPVEPKGSVSNVVEKIEEAIIHACHYGGVTHYRDLRTVEKIAITENGYLEGMVRK